MLRALPSAAATVDELLARAPAVVPRTSPQQEALADAPIHGATGALALMLAHAGNNHVDATNALLQAAFATLANAGPQTFAALLQDRMTRAEAIQFLWQVSRLHPGVWQAVVRQLGPLRASRWAWRMRRALPALWRTSPHVQRAV